MRIDIIVDQMFEDNQFLRSNGVEVFARSK
jgi:hypothetical protein